MRKTPQRKYENLPCSYVGTGCAFEDYTGKRFTAPLPEGLKENGWATMRQLNSYIRANLPVQRKDYFPRKERFKLKKWLATNTARAVVCVLGHLIYVNGKDYWSFFDNLNDDVVCIWYIA